MQKLIAIIFLACATIVIFHDVRDQAFVWDDKQNVETNELVSPATLSGTLRAWTSTFEGMYTPVPFTIWNATTRMFAAELPAKPDPQTLHVLSLIFHVLNVALVFLILCYFIDSSAAAFCGALVFALHPMQVEAVAWITASRYTMGAFFALVAIWQYLGRAKTRESGRSHRSKSNLRVYIASASFLLAILCHPAMIVTPLMAYVAEALLPRKNTLTRNQTSVLPIAVWLAMGTPFVVWSLSLQDTAALANQVALWNRPFVAGDALAFYLYKFFAPLGIGPDYGRSPHFILSQWWGYLTWMVPLLLALGLMFWQHKVRGLFAGAAGLFFIGILPFLGLLAFESQAMSTVADRYAYLAMLGPALALAHLMSIPRKVVLPFLGLIAIVAFGLLSDAQLEHWKSDQSLWSKSLKVNGASPIAHRVLGDRAREAGNWKEARDHYEHVLAVNNTDADIHFYLAEIAYREGRNASAIDLYAHVLQLNPEYENAYLNYGVSLYSEKQYDLARTYFEKAIALDGSRPTPHYYLGKTLLALEDKKAALVEFETALKHKEALGVERTAEAHALVGQALQRAGQKEAAQSHLEQALKISGEDLNSHRILADIYFEAGQLGKARIHYEQAASAFPEDALLFFNLGVSQIEGKVYDEAAKNFQKAIDLKPGHGRYVLNLAVAYFYLRRFGDAKTKFNEALELDKDLPDAHYYLGDMERWAGKIDRALGHYYLALKIDPNHAFSHYRLGNYFMEKDKVTQAIWHYNSGLKDSPENQLILGRLKSAKRKLEAM